MESCFLSILLWTVLPETVSQIALMGSEEVVGRLAQCDLGEGGACNQVHISVENCC